MGSELEVSHAWFEENEADNGGAGIAVIFDGKVNGHNLAFVDNRDARRGAGVYVGIDSNNQTRANLTNVTMVGNEAPSGSAICDNNGNGTFLNTDVSHNSEYGVSDNVTLDYSNVWNNTPEAFEDGFKGSHVVEEDPRYHSLSPIDLRLWSDSSLKDAEFPASSTPTGPSRTSAPLAGPSPTNG